VQGTDVFDSPEDAVQAARAANPRPPDAELRHRVLNNLMQMDDGRWTFRYDKALRTGTRPRPDPETVWPLLTRITAPTLLVRGAESDVLSPETAARMLQTIPNARMVEVPNSGHSVPLDSPLGFQEAVREFLR